MNAAQTKLVEYHCHIADALVWKLLLRLPRFVDREEFQSVAYEALTKAALSYDADDRRVVFSTWAWHRINGALIDHMRVILGRKVRRVENAKRRGQVGPRRPPPSALVSMSAPVATQDDALLEVGDTLADPCDIESEFADREFVAWAMRAMTARERFVVLGGAAGWTGSELAELLGVTESRVSQIRTRAAAKLRRRLRQAA